jgi:hypothetical protein
MNDTPDTDKNAPSEGKDRRRRQTPRTLHVVVRQERKDGPRSFNDAVIHGQELEALRSIIGKPDWHYVALRPGESLAEALKDRA